MITDKIKELQELQARADSLQQQIEAERSGELASLPSRYGFDSLESFIRALKQAGSGSKGRGGRRGGPAGARGAKKSAAKGAQGKRRRAKITPEMKDQVKSLVGDGKTGAQIAKQLRISLPSVQNIKKELGLVKARK